MANDSFTEVFIVIIACTLLFLILAAILLLFLFLYQRRRFMQQKELTHLQQQFKEQTLKAQIEIQEQTFLSISQEIHDNVGQILSLAKVQANIIGESGRLEGQLIDEVRENISKAMTELRDLSRSLNNERIRYGAIYASLAQEVERINRTGVLRAEVKEEGEIRDLDAKKKLILFRILQESLQNCLKHSQAANIGILFRYNPESVEVSIDDDGKGFDPSMVLGCGQGQGLDNIKTRTRLIGGSCHIDSAIGGGTHIKLMIPYE